MRSALREVLAGVLMFGLTVALGTPSARAQMVMPGSGRSLGGYGASAISSYYSGGSTAYVPSSGNSHGFVPYSGGPGGGLGVPTISRRLPQTAIGGTMMAQTPIGGASLFGGMGANARGGIGMGPGSSRPMLVPFGYEGGAGMAGMTNSSGMGMRRGPSGPGFGYPFRMPAGLGGGPSMSMP